MSLEFWRIQANDGRNCEYAKLKFREYEEIDKKLRALLKDNRRRKVHLLSLNTNRAFCGRNTELIVDQEDMIPLEFSVCEACARI